MIKQINESFKNKYLCEVSSNEDDIAIETNEEELIDSDNNDELESFSNTFINDNGKKYTVVERSKSGKNALLTDNSIWIIAWDCPEKEGSWGQGHYFFEEDEARKQWESSYLNESYKISLKENKKILNEAFSSSMPIWLKNALENEVRVYGDSAPKELGIRKKVRTTKGYDVTKETNIKVGNNTRGYAARYKGAKTLFAGFMAAGIDLSKAKFIQTDVPQKTSDKVIKDTIPIFLLKNDAGTTQIYAKGINDDQLSNLYPSGQEKVLKYVPVKTLLQHCIDFCYLDPNDKNNFIDPNLIQNRIDTADSLPNDYYRNIEKGKEAEKSPTGKVPRSMFGKDMFDKSGYLIDTEKYRKKLEDMGIFPYKREISKLLEEIDDLKSKVSNSLLTINSNRDAYIYRNIFSIFGEIYEGMDRIFKYSELGRNIRYQLSSVKSSINSINSLLDEHFSEVNW